MNFFSVVHIILEFLLCLKKKQPLAVERYSLFFSSSENLFCQKPNCRKREDGKNFPGYLDGGGEPDALLTLNGCHW